MYLQQSHLDSIDGKEIKMESVNDICYLLVSIKLKQPSCLRLFNTLKLITKYPSAIKSLKGHFVVLCNSAVEKEKNQDIFFLGPLTKTLSMS